LQQEVDTLQNERRDLKEQLRKKLFTNILNRQDSVTNIENSNQKNSGPESAALIEELKQVKNINRVLQKNCADLRHCLNNKMLSELPLLPHVTSTDIHSISSLKDIPPNASHPIGTSQSKDVNNLIKNSKDLMKVKQKLLNLTKVATN
jgi:hypothetical protein